MGRMGRMGRMGPMGRMGRMGAMGRMGPMGLMGRMGRMGLVLVLLGFAPAFCFSQGTAVLSASLTKQRNMGKWNVPGANYSGITRIGGNRYAVVSDKEKRTGFYVFDISIDSVKGKVREVSMISTPAMAAADNHAADNHAADGHAADVEDVAYVPSCHTVFLADEGRQSIVEYALDGRPTGRELLVPDHLSADAIYPNYGFESLTFSPKDSLLWTVTEHTLRNDGKRSSAANRAGCLLRLQSFSVETCRPVSSHYYRTDAPTVKKQGRNYAFGVSAITALRDGGLLLMEREFYVARHFLGSWVKIKIYRVDLRKKAADGCLQKELVVTFQNRLNAFNRNIANYEGMCLGPQLSDGRQTVILVSDSQGNFGNRFFHLKDYVRVLSFQ